jgi:hypothetical protein
VITSAREIVIALLLGLPLGPAALASLKQDGPWRRDTVDRGFERLLIDDVGIEPLRASEAHMFVLGVGGVADGGEVFGIAWHRRRFPDDNDRRSRAGREAPASPGAVRSRRRR